MATVSDQTVAPTQRNRPAKEKHTMTQLKEEFEAFHQAQPSVYQELRKMALEHRLMSDRGSISLLVEKLRPRYKIDNGHRAFYSRLLMDNEPELKGFFEIRPQRSA